MKVKTTINTLFILLVSLLISGTSLAGQPSQFKKILAANKMSLTSSKYFRSIPVKVNNGVKYDYAIKHKRKDLEVRYVVFSLSGLVTEYKKHSRAKKPNVVMTDPNKWHLPYTAAVINNAIGAGKLLTNKEFHKDSVKREYGADWGATYLLALKSDFGSGYKQALVVALHKKSVANAYVFFLSNDLSTVMKEIQSVYYSLKFKAAR